MRFATLAASTGAALIGILLSCAPFDGVEGRNKVYLVWTRNSSD